MRAKRAATTSSRLSVSRRPPRQLTSEKRFSSDQVGVASRSPALKPAGQHPQHNLQHGEASITTREHTLPAGADVGRVVEHNALTAPVQTAADDRVR